MHMRRLLRSSFASVAVVLFALGAAPAAFAQGVTGSAVTGTVSEEGGAPVEGASLQLRNSSTGDTFTSAAGSGGRFFLDNLPPGGPYQLTATAPGHQPTTLPDLQLTLGQRLNLEVVLRAAFTEEMTVVARRDVLGDRSRTGAATTVRGAAIADLPLQGRNFTDLISIDPRVTRDQNGATSILGQNNRYNNIQIDGGANNDLFGLAAQGTPGGQSNAKPLSVEAIQEFVVQVAPFDVRQGNFAGGLVNAITKSGTNEFHGSLFGYFQDKALAGFQGDPSFTGYNTWQFGGSLGGPIIKDKAHFFLSTDIQQRSSAFGNSFQLNGDDVHDLKFGGFTTATAQRFVDLLAQKGIANPGNALAPDLGNPDRNVFAKVTTSAIENSHLELSYNFVNARQDVLIRNPTSPAITSRLRDGYELSNSGYGMANTTNSARAKLTTNWDDGRFSNEFLAGMSFVRDARNVPYGAPLILVKAGKLGASDSWLAAGEERFSQDNILDQDIYQLQDNLTFSQGSHRITAGTSNEFFRFRNVFLQASTGVYAFDCLNAADCANSFEADKPSAFQRRFGVSSLQEPGTARFRVAQWGFYAQDEWSPMERLTLNPGVRIDVPFLSHANTNPVLLGSPTLPIDTSKVPSGNLLWSPRLGFNWDVEGNSNTVVRGGAGIFSGRPPYVWVSNAYTVNGLSQVELTCAGATGVPTFRADPNQQPSDCSGGTGTPTPPANQGEIDYFDPNTKYPQNLRFALGVDRRLPFDMIGSADFLYTRDVNGWYVTDENLNELGTNGEGRTIYGTFTPATTFSSAATSPITSRVDPVNLRQAVKVSNKDGGHVTAATLQLQKQFGRRYAVSVAYTYSRSLDRMSLTSSQAFSNFQFAPVDGSIADRHVRPSAFDRPHKVTVTGTANLPYGFILGLSYVGQSGLPYTWTVNGDVNGDGINGNDLAFVPADPSQISLSNPAQYAALSQFIDSQKCLREARGQFVQRGACRNPWQSFFDMRLAWVSPEVRGQRFEVQWDIFNVLNLASSIANKLSITDSQWGLYKQDTPFENYQSAFLKAVGYDAAARRPIYAFTAPSPITTTIYSPVQSRWRMQLGARYLF